MPITSSLPGVVRAFAVLGCFTLVLYLLSWLKPVLVPLALGMLFTFLLSPIVTYLERRKLPRVVAVSLVVLLTSSVIVGIGWGVARQVDSLVDSFPKYETNLKHRIEDLRSGQAGFLTKVRRAAARIERQIHDTAPPDVKPRDVAPNADDEPTRVVVMSAPRTAAELVSTYEPVVLSLGSAALCLVLVMFMLIGREDLRDRMIGLIGHGRLTVTTKALDDAGERISRFLLVQLAINGSYGAAVALGLYAIGLPYALMWGLFAGVLRYLPYVGPWIGALLPLGLSVLVAETWMMPISIAGLFVTLELICNMLVEPVLYGRGVGVSGTATLVMVAFWTWLWGPIGLVLATPLTVCLVVIGKYVPFLKFVDVLLSNQPALEPRISYYQRLLARDHDEASKSARHYFKAKSLVETFDELLLPSLVFAKRDRDLDRLDDDDTSFIVDATADIVEELIALRTKEKRLEETAENSPEFETIEILACPARDRGDELGLEMLQSLLDPAQYNVTITTTKLLAAEVVALVDEKHPSMLCIGALPPGGIAQVRLLCLRLRERFPDLKILVGRWGDDEDRDFVRDELIAVGADDVAMSLDETRDRISTFLPIAADRARNGKREAALAS